ncbi:DUF4105 domain-containing protein [Parafilimonas sp.]|uniref:lipoprotein N-acyltransferase Lnb domain-containing protein n=1 Tax=Parafilimonas sp. TaxID=1969739 RepID=UPI0039E65247
MKCFIIGICLLFISPFIKAQANSAHTRISVITCGPGDELYSLFGHTALRIIDSMHHTDMVYNWGGFTFDQPNFYLKFMRGKLLYYSSADAFPDFMYEYLQDHRSVYEQELKIDSASKQKIMDAISFNMQGNNRFYKYDFLLDNCTTRVKDIVLKNIEGAVIQNKIVPENTTARDLIHHYLERGGQHWTKMGIDILLGSRVDQVVSNDEAMFMPAFFMKGLAEATDKGVYLAKDATVILKGNEADRSSGKYVPLIILAIISIALFFVSGHKANWANKLTSFTDALLLYITGLIGVLLLFMWFATDHTVCKNNMNLVWALPFNLPVAFCLIKKPSWLSNYFFIIAVITAVFIVTWFFIPQQLNIALLPVVVLLLYRYAVLSNKYRKAA